jgi:hypothetical protein
LELVLGLPILMFMAALMVNYGTASFWKVRGLMVARQQLWASRQDRSGTLQPLPTYWQVAGATPPTVNGPGGVGSVSALSSQQLQQPVVVGGSPLPPTAVEDVQAALLDPTRGLLKGSSSLTQGFPMMARLGGFSFNPSSQLLDDAWPFWGGYMNEQWYQNPTASNIKFWLGQNLSTRLPVIYELVYDTGDANTYVQDVEAILENTSLQQDLSPMYHDADDYTYRQHPELRWGGLNYSQGNPSCFPTPNFGWTFNPQFPICAACNLNVSCSSAIWPSLSCCCSLPPNDDTYDQVDGVGGLVDHIQGRQNPLVWGVAKKLAWAYLNMYNTVYHNAKSALSATPQTLPADEVAYLSSLTDQNAGLPPIITALQAFFDSLPY